MGIGVDECMKFLITNILDRIEKCTKEEINPWLTKDRKNLILKHKKVTEISNNMKGFAVNWKKKDYSRNT